MSRDPVVRRLGSDPLYIGNRHAAAPDGASADEGPGEFDWVLTLSRRREPLTTHHHPLVDGPGNPTAAFDAAVDTARSLRRREGGLLVHCAAGISRSATVLATTLAAEETYVFEDGLAVVQRHRERACPHPALRDQARRYLRDGPAEDPPATDPGPRQAGQERADPPGDAPDGDESAPGRSLLDRLLGR